jgi:hypothetical protein
MASMITKMKLRFDLPLMLDVRPRQWLTRQRSSAASIGALGSVEQQALIDQLRAEMLSQAVDGELFVGSEWWEEARRRLCNHILHSDPRRFLRWPEIRTTMFVAYGRYIEAELCALQGDHAWAGRWMPALVEDPCGCPLPSRLKSDTSNTLIHHVYHLMTIERQLGDMGAFDEVIEFGGGYGSFARAFKTLGMAPKYHIHDLPEMTLLQRYFLRSVALHRRDPTVCENLTWGSSIDDIPPVAKSKSRLFVALWSLSETAAPERERWREVIAECRGAVFAFQGKFEGVDNRSWFTALQRTTDFSWSLWEIPHFAGNFYLIGRR